MIEYRSFRNWDPPQLARLWNDAHLGHGAALRLSNDESFDFVNYAQSYFDPNGLIIAARGSEVVGFAHAGFGCTSAQDALNHANGVICAVIVHPAFRKQGIATELVKRAEAYLRESGSQQIFAGPSPMVDPFYFGLYGGTHPIGFLDSDAAAKPFFEKLGYETVQRYGVFSRPIDAKDPVSFKLTQIRRKWEMRVVDRPQPATWWWMTRFGRMDALYCVLIPKGDQSGLPIAGVTVVGLDAYQRSWHEQVIGVADIWVDEGLRQKGFGQALLLDVIKRLRQESVSRLSANIPVDNEAGIRLFASVGFVETDQGTVFRKQK